MSTHNADAWNYAERELYDAIDNGATAKEAALKATLIMTRQGYKGDDIEEDFLFAAKNYIENG
jgi:hypothetical protein